MLTANDAPAIPLWINGHAFLTLAPTFRDVTNRLNGQVMRRTPMCGRREAEMAVDAAKSGLQLWQAETPGARARFLAALGNALSGYGEHFARLIVEETGKDEAAADMEVAECIALLSSAGVGDVANVIGIVGNAASPLLGAVRLAAPALKAGAAVVIRPSPEAPSALFALAELSGQCGFPDGIISIVYGGDELLEGLRVATACPLVFS